MHFKPFAASALLAAVLLFPNGATAGMQTFKIDAGHSGVNFKVRHFFSKVPGKFDKFTGTIKLDTANLAASSVEVSIDAKSINTGNEGRDKHLRSPDFFDAEKFPTITFKSTSVKVLSQAPGATQLQVTGDFTMKGVTKPVTLEVEFAGVGKAFGGMLAGFSAKSQVNRMDYGVSWNKAVEGTNVLGDTVDIDINVEAGEEAPAASAPAASAPKGQSSAPKASAPRSTAKSAG